MSFISVSTVLSSLISENHFLVPIINRFGIKLGMGDKTIADLCVEYDINPEFFLAILNTYLNEDYFPEKKLQMFELELLVDYLKKTDAGYMHASIPNIEKHLNAFIAMSDPENNQLILIKKLFDEFKCEHLNCVEKGVVENDTSHIFLLDIKNILIKHISGNFNENMCYAVLFSIDSLQNDLGKHNRIRTKILKPMIDELIEVGIEDWQSLMSVDKIQMPDRNEPISQRELEVLKLIVLGYLNKEIADELNISLNTVLSHRKNITSKLGIKTVSGLTFYCISHGHISPNAIDL